MDESEPEDAVNPYESPREHGYIALEYLLRRTTWRAWLRDRLLLWGCGWTVFFSVWASCMVVAWLLGYLG
jgi:hypothetical protein